MPSVLIVDDSPLVRRALHQMLSEVDGIERVGAAPSAEDALLLLGNDAAPRFDVLILDLLLPGMSGLELMRALRERWGERAPATIVVSLHGDEPETRRKLELAGARRVLGKPVFRTQLFDALAGLVPGRSAARGDAAGG